MIIPIYPKYISFNNWAGRLIEDNIYDQLPIQPPEDKWKEWATAVSNTTYLSDLDVPDPNDLGENITWQDWAKEVYHILMAQQVITTT